MRITSAKVKVRLVAAAVVGLLLLVCLLLLLLLVVVVFIWKTRELFCSFLLRGVSDVRLEDVEAE